MPRDERHPTPLLNMNPAGLPGFMVVLLMFLGIWQLLGGFFVFGLAIMSLVALVVVLLIRDWRANHPRDKSLLHLDSVPGKRKGTDEPQKGAAYRESEANRVAWQDLRA